MLTPQKYRRYNNQPVFVPTLAYCREIVGRWSREKLLKSRESYQENVDEWNHDTKAVPARLLLLDYYRDMVRAIDDELLGRDLDAADDPFFETAVEEYQPGDMIDFGC